MLVRTLIRVSFNYYKLSKMSLVCFCLIFYVRKYFSKILLEHFMLSWLETKSAIIQLKEYFKNNETRIHFVRWVWCMFSHEQNFVLTFSEMWASSCFIFLIFGVVHEWGHAWPPSPMTSFMYGPFVLKYYGTRNKFFDWICFVANTHTFMI